MAGRRAITEQVVYDEDSDEGIIDLNNLRDEDMQAALEMAYAMEGEDEDEEE